MPVLFGAVYLVGLAALISLAHKAGQSKARREEVGADDFYQRGWYTLMVKPPGGKYRYEKYRYLDWPGVLDWKFEFPYNFERVAWKWDGRRWVQEDVRSVSYDPRYGDQRTASR